jgi:hypothetical protein
VGYWSAESYQWCQVGGQKSTATHAWFTLFCKDLHQFKANFNIQLVILSLFSSLNKSGGHSKDEKLLKVVFGNFIFFIQ